MQANTVQGVPLHVTLNEAKGAAERPCLRVKKEPSPGGRCHRCAHRWRMRERQNGDGTGLPGIRLTLIRLRCAQPPSPRGRLWRGRGVFTEAAWSDGFGSVREATGLRFAQGNMERTLGVTEDLTWIKRSLKLYSQFSPPAVQAIGKANNIPFVRRVKTARIKALDDGRCLRGSANIFHTLPKKIYKEEKQWQKYSSGWVVLHWQS